MSTPLKPLSTLPKSGQAYRVDYVGNIQRNPNSSSNHLVDILLSPVANNFKGYRNLAFKDSVRMSEQQRYQISIGEFFAFHPGCALRRGQVIWRPLKSNFSEELSITSETTQFIKASEKTDFGGYSGYSGYLIPPREYKLGSALGSNLLAVSRNGDPYSVLIPVMEVVRFYYSGSSKFNRTLFSPQIVDLNNLVDMDTARYNSDKRYIKLDLRRDYRDSDAQIIGRLLTSRKAHAEAMKIWKALIQFQHNRNVNYASLEVGFPFSGNTELSAHGIYLPTPKNCKHKRFLVLSLIHCSYPLPFDIMELDRKNNSDKGLLDNPGELLAKPIAYPNNVKVPAVQADSDQDKQEGENDPFSNPSGYVEDEVAILKTDRFPPVKIEKVIKQHTSHRSGYLDGAQPIELPNQSTSDSTFGDTDSAPLCIAPEEKILESTAESEREKKRASPKSLSAEFDVFENICDLLSLNHSEIINSVKGITINGGYIGSEVTDCLSVFPTYSGYQEISWAITGRKKMLPIARKALLKEVKSKFGVHYLLEIERKKAIDDNGQQYEKDNFAIYIYANTSCTGISVDQHAVLFQYLAETSFKGYKKSFRNLGFRTDSRKHIGTKEGCAQSLVNKLIQLQRLTE